MTYLRQHGIRNLQELGTGAVLGKLWKGFLESDPAMPTGPLRASSLGSEVSEPFALGTRFCRVHGSPFPYWVGAATAGIRGTQMVRALLEAGLPAILDPCERSLDQDLKEIGLTLEPLEISERLGVAFRPSTETEVCAAAFQHRIRLAEAEGYEHPSDTLICFRFRGAHRDSQGRSKALRRLLVSARDPETARRFSAPPAPDRVEALVAAGRLSAEEGHIAASMPLCSELCAVAGTDDGPDLTTLLPTFLRLSRQSREQHGYHEEILVGAGGALGCPETLACAFMLGADFVQPAIPPPRRHRIRGSLCYQRLGRRIATLRDRARSHGPWFQSGK